MTQFETLLLQQLEYYAERILFFTEAQPDKELEMFFRGEAAALLAVENEDEIMALTYHRHLSDSQGVVFELEHGDTELMFGGI